MDNIYICFYVSAPDKYGNTFVTGSVFVSTQSPYTRISLRIKKQPGNYRKMHEAALTALKDAGYFCDNNKPLPEICEENKIMLNSCSEGGIPIREFQALAKGLKKGARDE